jgi:L-ascorbate metabolism protein UlaG (beta-lactamase superfamily)
MARGIAMGLGALVLLAACTLYYLLFTYVDPPVDPAWAIEGTVHPPKGAVTARWTGTSTLVFSDGETTLIIDGWFSRPGPLSMLYGEIAPDLEAIEQGLARNAVTRAAMVVPVHAHYDHAMDSPEVAKRTGALLVGSEATAQIGRGWGLPEEQIRVVRDGERLQLGAFEVVFHETRHFEFPDPAFRERALGDPDIPEPLVPPVPAFDYKVGVPLAVEVRHPRGSLLVQGSAGFVPGGLADVDVDVLFMGTGGLGSQTAGYRETYWRETVDATRPSRVVPIHWDALFGPIEGPFRGSLRAASFVSTGGELALEFLREKAAANPDLRFETFPRYDPVVLY